jgi:ankyrin repeat protein
MTKNQANLNNVKTRVNQGMNINNVSQIFGNAVMSENIPLVRYLISKGANVNVTVRNYHMTPLMIASEVGNLNICRLLVHAGAHINAQNAVRKTPLMFAAGSNNPNNLNIVRYLVEQGAHINMRNNMGVTALAMAAMSPKRNRIAIIRFLMNEGAQVTKADINAISFFNNENNTHARGRNVVANALGARVRAKAAVRKITTSFRQRVSNKILGRLFGSIKVNTPQGKTTIPFDLIKQFGQGLTPRR